MLDDRLITQVCKVSHVVFGRELLAGSQFHS